MGAQITAKATVTDRRAIRTRAAITSAFLRLLETTPYHKVTISAVAREAGINRKTFYLHFESIEELLQSLVNDGIIESVDAVTHQLGLRKGQGQHQPDVAFRLLTTAILQQLARNITLNAGILENVPTSTLLEMAADPLRSVVNAIRQERHGTEVPDLDYLLACYLGSLIACFREWQREPNPRPPLAQVSATICELFADKARELL